MVLHLSLPAPAKVLDDRRLHYLRRIEWDRGSALIGLGPDRDGRVREIWIDEMKQGSDFLTEAAAGCMMASWLLQSGKSADELLAKLLGGPEHERATGVIVPSVTARALAEAVRLEAEHGDEIRENYAHEEVTRADRRTLLGRKAVEGRA
jgi:hypothetical protein